MDTDVASRLQRNDLDPAYDSLLEGHILVLTFVTVAEMLRGAAKAGKLGCALQGGTRGLAVGLGRDPLG